MKVSTLALLRNKMKLNDVATLVLETFDVPERILGVNLRQEAINRIAKLSLAETEKLISDLRAILDS